MKGKPLVDKKGKPKLQLKGRIFMQNVTDIVSAAKQGECYFCPSRHYPKYDPAF